MSKGRIERSKRMRTFPFPSLPFGNSSTRRSASHRVASCRLGHRCCNCTQTRGRGEISPAAPVLQIRAWILFFFDFFGDSFGPVLFIYLLCCVFFLSVCARVSNREPEKVREFFTKREGVKDWGKGEVREKKSCSEKRSGCKERHRVTCEVVVLVLWVVCFRLWLRASF